MASDKDQREYRSTEEKSRKIRFQVEETFMSTLSFMLTFKERRRCLGGQASLVILKEPPFFSQGFHTFPIVLFRLVVDIKRKSTLF